jgi:dihydroxy-acid dehydratase
MAAVRDGDTIEVDVERRELRLLVPADELDARLAAVVPPAPRYATGVLARYARLVSSASEGAVLT